MGIGIRRLGSVSGFAKDLHNPYVALVLHPLVRSDARPQRPLALDMHLRLSDKTEPTASFPQNAA